MRDGDEHTCDEAVSHLRLKLGNTRNRIDTAEQFIDKGGLVVIDYREAVYREDAR